MNKKIIKDLKEKLKEEKEAVETKLKSFAKKDDKLEGDWDSQFPRFSDGGSDSELDIAAEEVEEYINLLPIEHILEIRLININSALKKIEGKNYGFCEECKEKINLERLKACPEAKYCMKCKELKKEA